MFHKMRRSDRQITQEECLECLIGGEFGMLTTYGENEYPTAMPYNYVVSENYIYIHCSMRSNHTLASVKHHAKASFTYVGKTTLIPEEFVTDYISVIVFGEAMIMEQEEKKRALRLFIDKYAPHVKELGYQHVDEDMDKACVVGLKIEHMTGKKRQS